MKTSYSGMLSPINGAIASAYKQRLQSELSKLLQYEPVTRNYFHAGMYVREVWRDAGVLVVGAVHKKPHFYQIISGTVSIDGSEPITGPVIFKSEPGTKRTVLSLTPVLCQTIHITNATSVEEAEAELIEHDPNSMYLPGNKVKHLELEEVAK